MTASEICQHLSAKIGPQLEEFGVESFLMLAIVRDTDGKVSKVSIGADGSNPAYADSLARMKNLAQHWGRGEL